MKDLIYYDTFGQGAVGTVTYELVTCLHACEVDITLAGESRVLRHLLPRFPSLAEEATVVDCSHPDLSPGWWFRKIRNRVSGVEVDGDGVLRRLMATTRGLVDSRCPLLINYPQEIPAPKHGKAKVAVLVHDTNWREYPENFRNPDSVDRNCRNWVEYASTVLTISNVTRDEVMRHYGIASGKVVVAPLAAPSKTQWSECPTDDNAVLERYGLVREKYYLYPAALKVHKGHDYLVDALRSVGSHFPVVLCGSGTDVNRPMRNFPHGSYLERVTKGLREMGDERKVCCLGHLQGAEMNSLAKGARAFLLPSRYEGFGFPFVEAVELGRPVICSEIPAFRELAERYSGYAHCRMFRLGDPSSLSEMLRADWSGKLDYARVAGGIKSKPLWTWNDTARILAGALGLDVG